MHTKRKLLYAALAVVTASLAGFGVYRAYTASPPLPAQYYAPHAAGPKIPRLDHIIVIVEENKTAGSIIGDDDAPYINELAKQYTLARNYYAVTHPSLPNYVALTSGTTAGIANDCNPPGGSCSANVQNIGDAIEAAGHTWKMYAEGMPAPCTIHNTGAYATKHNPFLYYPAIRNDTARCTAHDVPFTQLASDLKTAATLPDLVFISPDLCNDMHNCPVKSGDTWLSQQVPKLLDSPAFTQQHSLLVITWDEGVGRDNNVPAIFIGPQVKRGFTSDAYYSHYSLLRTIEDSWGLAPLTPNDRSAPPINDIFR